MGAVVLEAIEVLVALATRFALVWLVFFHAERAGVRRMRVRIHDRVGAVGVLLKLLGLVAVLKSYISG